LLLARFLDCRLVAAIFPLFMFSPLAYPNNKNALFMLALRACLRKLTRNLRIAAIFRSSF